MRVAGIVCRVGLPGRHALPLGLIRVGRAQPFPQLLDLVADGVHGAGGGVETVWIPAAVSGASLCLSRTPWMGSGRHDPASRDARMIIVCERGNFVVPPS